MGWPDRPLGGVCMARVHERRIRVLADAIAPAFRRGWHVLDIGCGDGCLAGLIADRVDGLDIEGYEVLVREGAAIRVKEYDGRRIPVEDKSVDAVLFVDVLHHAEDPMALMVEAKRVAREAIVIKDHRLSRPLAGPVLRFMDRSRNEPCGVALPYNYWPVRRWQRVWQELNLTVEHYQTRIGLYPWPANWVFEAGLHFIAWLNPGPAE